APWLPVAEREMSVHELPGAAQNARILLYHRSTRLGARSDEVPWCSSFVNWCLRRTAVRGTDSAVARSWLGWGEELCEPKVGSIVVLQGEHAFEGHVGFYLETRGSEVVVLGGNQDNEVNVKG